MWHLNVAALYTEEDKKSFSSHVQRDRDMKQTEAEKRDFVTSLVKSASVWNWTHEAHFKLCSH